MPQSVYYGLTNKLALFLIHCYSPVILLAQYSCFRNVLNQCFYLPAREWLFNRGLLVSLKGRFVRKFFFLKKLCFFVAYSQSGVVSELHSSSWDSVAVLPSSGEFRKRLVTAQPLSSFCRASTEALVI